MKRIILLAIMLFVLTACASDLPPEPGTPGVGGQYYRAIGDWATLPFNGGFAPIWDLSGEIPALVLNTYASDDIVYTFYYMWHESSQSWKQLYLEGARLGNSNWIEGSGTDDFTRILEHELSEFADANGELYVVFYTCSRAGEAWDCHGNKWQLDIQEVPSMENIGGLSCVESNPNKTIYDRHNVTRTEFQGSVILDRVTQYSSCIGTDYLTQVSCDVNSNIQANSVQCPYGCDNGACIQLPNDPNAPGAIVGTMVHGENYLELNNPKLYNTGSEVLTFELIAAGRDCALFESQSITLDIGGETATFEEGETKAVGLHNVSVIDIFVVNIPEESASANIKFDEREFYITHGDSVQTDSALVELVSWNQGACLEYGAYFAILDIGEVRRQLQIGMAHIDSERNFGLFVEDIFVTNVPESSASMIVSFGPLTQTTTFVSDENKVTLPTIRGPITLELRGPYSSDGRDYAELLINGNRFDIQEGAGLGYAGIEVYVQDLFISDVPTSSVSANLGLLYIPPATPTGSSGGS